MKTLKEMYNVIPAWQRRLMLVILIVGVYLLTKSPGPEVEEFITIFLIVCVGYAWVMVAYKRK